MHYRAPRLPVDNRVRLVCKTGEHTALLRNIGPQGLCVSGVPERPRGEKVQVLLAGQMRNAVVMWSRGSLTGLRLDRGLTDFELATIRGVPVARGAGAPSWNHTHTAQRFREL